MKKAPEASQAISHAFLEVGIHENRKETDTVLLSFQKGKIGTLPKTSNIDEQELPVSARIEYFGMQMAETSRSPHNQQQDQYYLGENIEAQPSAAIELYIS